MPRVPAGSSAHRTPALAALALVLALALPGPAAAHTPRTRHTRARAHLAAATAEPAATAPAAQRPASVVALDPETGTLGAPTPAQTLALSAAMRNALLRTGAGLTAVRLPNGAMMIDLQGRYREFAVYRIGADGVSRFDCVHGADGVTRALEDCPQAAATAPAGMEWSDR